MEIGFDVAIIPEELFELRELLEKYHKQLSDRRVIFQDRLEERVQFDALLKEIFANAWKVGGAAFVKSWLENTHLETPTSYETWVLWSLSDLMNEENLNSIREAAVSESPVLPIDLGYFENEAILAKLESNVDAMKYAESVSDTDKARLEGIGMKMKANAHATFIYKYLQEHSIVELQHSRWLFWFLGALDYLDISVE